MVHCHIEGEVPTEHLQGIKDRQHLESEIATEIARSNRDNDVRTARGPDRPGRPQIYSVLRTITPPVKMEHSR